VTLEQKYRAMARSPGMRKEHWPTLFPSTTMIYNVLLQVANFSRATDRFWALMKNYRDHVHNLPQVSIEIRTTYAAFRRSQDLLHSLLNGDIVRAEKSIGPTRGELIRRISAIEESGQHYWQGFLSLLDNIEVEVITRRGKLEAARRLYSQQRQRTGARSDFLAMRPLCAGVFLAEGSGDCEQALKELDMAWERHGEVGVAVRIHRQLSGHNVFITNHALDGVHLFSVQ
jgi:hypothetical protein